MKPTTFLFVACSFLFAMNRVVGSVIDDSASSEWYGNCSHRTFDKFFNCLMNVQPKLSNTVTLNDMHTTYGQTGMYNIDVDVRCENITIQGFSKLRITKIDKSFFKSAPKTRRTTIFIAIPKISSTADCYIDLDFGITNSVAMRNNIKMEIKRENVEASFLIPLLKPSVYREAKPKIPPGMVQIYPSDLFSHYVPWPEAPSLDIGKPVNFAAVTGMVNKNMRNLLQKHFDTIISKALEMVLMQIRINSQRLLFSKTLL